MEALSTPFQKAVMSIVFLNQFLLLCILIIKLTLLRFIRVSMFVWASIPPHHHHPLHGPHHCCLLRLCFRVAFALLSRCSLKLDSLCIRVAFVLHSHCIRVVFALRIHSLLTLTSAGLSRSGVHADSVTTAKLLQPDKLRCICVAAFALHSRCTFDLC